MQEFKSTVTVTVTFNCLDRDDVDLVSVDGSFLPVRDLVSSLSYSPVLDLEAAAAASSSCSHCTVTVTVVVLHSRKHTLSV
jgi:hypothetical protein